MKVKIPSHEYYLNSILLPSTDLHHCTVGGFTENGVHIPVALRIYTNLSER